jgi:hypothetical protein
VSNKDKIDALEKKLDKAKTEFAKEFKARWDRRTPVVSGTLQKGNIVTVAAGQFEFTNDVHYFPFVENGTPHQKPVGMLKTTVHESADIWEKAMRKAGL